MEKENLIFAKPDRGEREEKKGERKCGRTDSEDDTSQPLPTGRLNEDSEVQWGGAAPSGRLHPPTPPAGSVGHTMNREKMGRVLLQGA